MRMKAPVLLPLMLCVIGLTTVAGQGLQPVPAGIKASEREDAPLTIKLNGVEPEVRGHSPLSFDLKNAAGKNVRAVVVTGVPGAAKYSAIFGTALKPGDAEAFSVGNVLDKKLPRAPEIAVDFVLFDDGTTWGPNSARDGDHLMGVFEGRKAAYADALRLTEMSTENELTTWLNSPEMQTTPPGYMRVFNTKWSAGYVQGYSLAHQTFRRDFNRRGTFSIGLRLQAMQRDLGLPSTKTTAAKP